MSTPLLKDLYSPAFYRQFATVLKKVLPTLSIEAFEQAIFDKLWPERELKDRMRHTSQVLHQFLPQEFPAAAAILMNLLDELEKAEMTTFQLEFMFIPDYVEQYGQEHYEVAVSAMERITQLTSCEFAVRPFIIRYEEKMMQRMLEWTKHPHEEVRRLASEGCRPRLPWAMALPAFKKDPAPILPILEALKADDSLYIRRSVANNLNDISKDNPAIALRIFNQWKGQKAEIDWIIKHACRTLLKAGLPEAMQIFGYCPPEQIDILDFKLEPKEVPFTGSVQFSFTARNTQSTEAKVRIEYAMYFLRANGSHSRKVFMIKEQTMKGAEEVAIQKPFSFKPISTRRYYPGQHRLAIVVNGVEKLEGEFILQS